MNSNMTITIQAKDRFTGEMNRLIKDMGSMSSRVKAAFSNVQTKFSNFTKGIVGSLLKVFTAYKAISLGKEILKLGSDSMEVENLFRKTFGSMTNEMNAFGQSLKEVSGISDLTFRNQISKLYTLAHNMGLSTEQSMKLSKSLMQTGLDLASLRNVPIETMFNQLRGGMVGIIKPLREYGINLEISNVKQYAYAKGIAEVGTELTQTQKVMARYGIIMQSTANAQGDVANTIEAPANALKRLQERLKDIMANLGQGFMPLVASVLRMLNKLANWLYIVSVAFKQASAAIFGKVEGKGIGATNDALGGLVDTTNDLAKAQRSLTPMDEITNLSDSKSSASNEGIGYNFNELNNGDGFISDDMSKRVQDLQKKLEMLFKVFRDNENLITIVGGALVAAFGIAKMTTVLKGITALLGVGKAGATLSGLLGLKFLLVSLGTALVISIVIKGLAKLIEDLKIAYDRKKKLLSLESSGSGIGGGFSSGTPGTSGGGGGGNRFASGGVVNSPLQALVAEYPNARSNPEIITPEDKMYNTMVSAFENVLPRLQQPTPQQNGTTILNINGREFAKAIKSDLQYEDNRSGASTIIRRS